jgi:8-oxo-dGTP diphosphatase
MNDRILYQDGYPRHIVAVTGVVTDPADRVLLVKGYRRGWEPPGGQVELGEDLVAALEREVLEESGCEVEVGRLLSVNSNLGRPEEGVPAMVVLAFSCEWIAGEPRAADECVDARWFSLEEALGQVAAPQQKAKLLDAFRPERGLRYRSYRTHPYEAFLDERL